MKKRSGSLPAFLMLVLFALLTFSVKSEAGTEPENEIQESSRKDLTKDLTNIIWSGSRSGGALSVSGTTWKDGYDFETGQRLFYLDVPSGETEFWDVSFISHSADYDMAVTIEKAVNTGNDMKGICLFTEGSSAGTLGCRNVSLVKGGEGLYETDDVPLLLNLHLDVFEKGTDRRIKIPKPFYRISDFSDTPQEYCFDSGLLMQGVDLTMELNGTDVYGIYIASEQYTAEYRSIYGSVERSGEKVWAGCSPEGTEDIPDENFHFVKWVADRDILLRDGTAVEEGEALTLDQIRRTVMTEDVIFTAFHEKNPRVSYRSDPFGMITGRKSEYVAENANPSGTVESPLEGYKTLYWKADQELMTGDGISVKPGQAISFEEMMETVITEDVVFEAVHQRIPKVVYQTDGHGRITGIAYEYLDNEICRNPSGSKEKAEEGWVFRGWSCNQDVFLEDGTFISSDTELSMSEIQRVRVSEDLVFTALHRPCPLLSLEKDTEWKTDGSGLLFTVRVRELTEDTWAENVTLCIQNPEGVVFDTNRITASKGSIKVNGRTEQNGPADHQKGVNDENRIDESGIESTAENSGSKKGTNGEKNAETAEKEIKAGDQTIIVTIKQLDFEEDAVVRIPVSADPETGDPGDDFSNKAGDEPGEDEVLVYAVCSENSDEIVTGTEEAPVYRTIDTGIINGTITPSAKAAEGSSYTVSYQPRPGFFIEKILLDGAEQEITLHQNEFELKEIHEDHDLEVICRKTPSLSVEVVSDKEIYREDETAVFTVRTNQTVEDTYAADVVIRMENPRGLVFDPESVIVSKGKASVYEETDENGSLRQTIEVCADRLEHDEDMILTFSGTVNEELEGEIITNTASAVCREEGVEKEDDTRIRIYCSVTTSVKNGLVSGSDERITPGELFNGRYSPEEGFYLTSVSVDGREMDPQEYENEYLFENIRSCHTLDVVYSPVVPFSENRRGILALSRSAEAVKDSLEAEGDSGFPLWYSIAGSAAAGILISILICQRKIRKKRVSK